MFVEWFHVLETHAYQGSHDLVQSKASGTTVPRLNLAVDTPQYSQGARGVVGFRSLLEPIPFVYRGALYLVRVHIHRLQSVMVVPGTIIMPALKTSVVLIML